MSLTQHKRDWDDLGRIDPLWAVLTSPENRFGNWDLEEFFASGAAEIARVMRRADELGFPQEKHAAMDFGCGVGRLTRALAEHFERCVGVDISESMLAQAREWNRGSGNCEFVLNVEGHLHRFKDRSFDLVYSNIVLQHLPDTRLIESYVTEFIRILSNGGLLVFQLPSYIPWKNRIQPRRRAYRLLRALGASEKFLLHSLMLTPMRMNFVPEAKVQRLIEAAGGMVLFVERLTNICQTYYVTRQ